MSFDFAQFCRDRRGNVALLFALLLGPLFAAVAMGSDEIQVRSLRQTLQRVADESADHASTFDPALSEDDRRAAALATLRKELALERIALDRVGAKVDFNRPKPQIVVATVTVEARPDYSFGLLRDKVGAIRIVSKPGRTQARGADRHIKCHAAATQAEYEALGC